MCGIVGFFAPKMAPEWRKWVLDQLLCEAKERGKDATGITYIGKDGKLKVVKAGEEATRFVFHNDDYAEATEGKLPALVLGHTRGATTPSHIDGGPANPINDHPFFSPASGLAMIHNGVIQDDEVWRKTVGMPRGIKFKPTSQVDSEIALRIVETFLSDTDHPELANMEDAIEDMAYNLAGSYVLVFLSEKHPNKVWFVRHGNPLTLAFLPKQNAVVWGSTQTIIQDALTENNSYAGGFFSENNRPKMIFQEVALDELVCLTWDEKKGFDFQRRKLECGTFDYKHHKEAFAKQLAAGKVEETKEDDDLVAAV